MVNTVWQFATAKTIKFGRGASEQLPNLLRHHHLQRPLIVTDQNLMQQKPIAQLIDSVRTQVQVHLFDQCAAEPSVAIAELASSLALAAESDCIIGIGGGSNLDVAKVAATVAKHGGSPQDYFGFDAIPGPVLPIFALPTTAGTGSEVSHSAVLTNVDQQVKVSTLSQWLRPMYALVDPALTDSCPATVTGHSGIDALVHAIEAITNRDFSDLVDVDPQARAYEGSYPLTRLLAAEAIRLVGQNLPVVCQHPSDRAARDGMALASTLAGMAFSNSGVGIVHALEYPIGALTHCSHGEGNGLLLPHVMQFNLETCTAEYALIAEWLGAKTHGLSAYQAAEGAIEMVVRLQQHAGVRRCLRELGLSFESIPQVAAKALEIRRLMDLNVRRPTLVDLQSILEAAY